MSRYTVSMYLTIEAETEEEAPEIADTLELSRKMKRMKKRYFGAHSTQKLKKNRSNMDCFLSEFRNNRDSKEEIRSNLKERRCRYMKYYLADFDIRDGDNEYSLQFLVQAENLEDAENKAIDGLCVNFGVERNAWDAEQEELDLFSRIIRRGNIPQEIPDNEAAVLKKYFWMATEFTQRQGK